MPLRELPAARPTGLAELVPGPALLYAESPEPRALAAAVQGASWYPALARAGAADALAQSRAAATALALAQRLNDLSRSPIGEEALADLLDGPLALAARPAGPERGRSADRGGFDALLVKAVGPRAQGALRLAEMLEAVHPSAQQVRVERHSGIPLRHLRVDGTRQLYYFVLRDRVVLGTDLAWVTGALDLALGLPGPAPLQPALAEARARCAAAQGSPTSGGPFGACLVVDAEVARDAPGLGGLGRALAGLRWAALRWRASEPLEVGVHRARGAFAEGGPALPAPPGALLSLEREATLPELLTLAPEPADAVSGATPPGATDGGPAPGGAGRSLLRQAEGALAPALGAHVLYALAGLDERPGGARHLLLLESPDPARASRAMEGLAPALFRAAPQRPEPNSPALCEGNPAQLCFGPSGGALALATGPLPAAHPGPKPVSLSGPFALYLDPAELAAQLARAGAAFAGRSKLPPAEARARLEPLATALAGVRPLLLQTHTAPGGTEAWGKLLSVEEPRKPDGGAP